MTSDVQKQRGAETELRLPAIEVRQRGSQRLYTFAIDGKRLSAIAAISRLHRDDESQIQGYQRPEVLAHIASIRRYIESDEAMIPNALVVAFDERVRFEASDPDDKNYSRAGTLVIPTIDLDDPPGWIVDGQQRLAAIRDAKVKQFPVCVTAFITSSAAEQRAQFILVNSTKPLPKGLIYELLPTTDALLPPLLQLRRFPAQLVQRLNHDADSPLRGLIQTPTTPTGIIKDNSILRMLENSLSDGVLYRYREARTGGGDTEAMLRILKDFWTAVEAVFYDAWGQPPRRSRLMHGVGVISLGFVMDAIGDRHSRTHVPTAADFATDLEPLAEVCRWTHGYWEFGPQSQRKWNELQNTSKDINLLANYLLLEYKARVWSRLLQQEDGLGA